MVKAVKTTKKINYKEKLNDDTLDLSMCSLELVPVKEIAEVITKAKTLNLSYNALTFLPEDFIKFANIRELDISKNRLKSLPNNFGAMTSLKTLDLLGNQLTALPSSFADLRNLQWLDLKDNPLNPELKQAVGECGNEIQCKKCANNVIRYQKYVSAVEEQEKQIQLKVKKDQQNQHDELAKKKSEELKVQKKEEREQRRLMNEQRKREYEEKYKNENFEIYQKENPNHLANEKKRNSSSLCWLLFKTLLYLCFFGLICVGIFLISINYCNNCQNFKSQKPLVDYLKYPYVKQTFQLIDDKVCPLTKFKQPEWLKKVIASFNSYHL